MRKSSLFSENRKSFQQRDHIYRRDLEKILEKSHGKYDIYNLFLEHSDFINLKIPPTLYKKSNSEAEYIFSASNSIKKIKEK